MEEHHGGESINLKFKKSSLWKAGTVVFGLLFIWSFFFSGDGSTEGTDSIGQPSAAAPSLPTGIGSASAKDFIDDDAVKGNKNAKLTIVEWSDFECPFCGRFYGDTLGQIEKQYIDTGKVKLVYRDFPLGFHPQAQKAAEASECAGEQDKFWEMHDLLFEKGVQGGVSSFKQYAKDIGLDTSKFNTCLDSGAMAGEVKKDMSDGERAGIRGTPGFLVGNQLVSGAQPFENFKQVIDAQL